MARMKQCIKDDILEFVRVMWSEKERCDCLVQAEGEVHVQMAMNVALRLPPVDSLTQILEWLGSL